MQVFPFIAALTLAATTAGAQPARVPVSSIVAEALDRNPDVAAAAKRLAAARQRPVQERALPDPNVSVGWMSSGNPLPGAGLGTEPTATIGAMVSQELPLPARRALRATMARREADAEARQIDTVRLSVTARVKQAYYRLAYAWAVEDVLTRNRDLLDTLLAVSENRYAVGRAAQQDVIKAQAQLSILEIQLARVRQERDTREGELNTLRNRPLTTPVGRPDDLTLTHFEGRLEDLVTATAAHAPSLARERILIDRADDGVQAARLEYRPDFMVSGGYSFMGAMPSMYEFRFDVRVPLQRAKRAAAVVEQQARADQARLEADGTRLGLEARLSEDYRAATTSERLATLYRDTVLPQARLALESSMASYQTGSVEFLSVLSNFGTVLEYEMRYFEELAAFHTAASRIEETTGMALVH